jgi:RimJ/RimL family protein N-acetyltransferase
MTVHVVPEHRRRAPGAVGLRPLRMSDAVRVRQWMADPAMIRFTVVVPGPEYGPLLPYSTDEADQYLETLVRDPSRRSYAIEVRDSHEVRHVGNVGLKDYQPERKETECFIELGDQSARGRGVGQRAMHMLLRVAFDELKLERVRLGVFEFNQPAINLYRRLGFVDEGRYGWHYADGRFWEVNAMCLLRRTWLSLA